MTYSPLCTDKYRADIQSNRKRLEKRIAAASIIEEAFVELPLSKGDRVTVIVKANLMMIGK